MQALFARREIHMLDGKKKGCYKEAMWNNNVFTALPGVAVLVAPAYAVEEKMELTVGESTSITLPGNPTTGYMWAVAESPDAVKVEIALKEQDSPTGMVGCPRASVVTITAVQTGQGVVKLVYARPWEKDKAPAETRLIHVNVK